MLFIEYPKCSTCKKAKAFLDDNNAEYIDRDIKLDRPSKKELDEWIKVSGKDIYSFFNTSGIKYRELNLKETLKELSYEEKLDILSSDGMLVKRPILIFNKNVLIGFKVKEWESLLKRKDNK